MPTGSIATFRVATKCFAFLGLGVALLGCRGGPAPDIVSPTATPPTDWFCEATGAEWDCAEAEDGKVVPRSAPVERQVAVVTDEPESGVVVAAAPREEQRQAAPEPRGEVERPQRSPSGLASLHRDAPETLAPAEPANISNAPEIASAAPAYLQLAYRPDREVAFTELPDEFYAVQLLALSSPEAVEEFVTDAGVPGLAAARVERDGRLFYVLLMGIYRNRADAVRAAGSPPAELEGLTPWIRPLSTLKEAMLRADDLVVGEGDS